MSHSDRLHSLPEGFTIIATTESAPFAAIAHNEKPIYGIQFHPEVTHSLKGKDVLRRFILNICDCKQEWTMVSYIFRNFKRFFVNSDSFYRTPSSTKRLNVFVNLLDPRDRLLELLAEESIHQSLPS